MAATDPADPRKPKGAIDEQIVLAISRGFDTVLKSSVARDQEMVKALREITGVGAFGKTMRPISGAPVPASVRNAAGSMQAHLMARPAGPALFDDADDGVTRSPYGNKQEHQGPYNQFSTRRGLRSWMYDKVANAANNVSDQAEEGTYPGPDGTLYRINPHVHMDKRGRYHGYGGGFLSPTQAGEMSSTLSPTEAGGIRVKRGMSNVVNRARDSFVSGEAGIGKSLLNAMPEGFLRGVAGAGAAWEGVNKGLDFARGAEKQVLDYRENYGPSSGSEAFHAGARRWMNRNITGRFSLLGGGAYDQLDDAASSYALRGAAKERFISTGVGLRYQGVNSEQTNSILGIATQGAQGLQGLAAAIRSVDEAAKSAGVSAKKARDIFISNYQTSSSLLFGSSSAKSLATTLTKAQVGFGNAYSNVSYAGVTSNAQSFLLAGEAGMSQTDFTAMIRKDPTQLLTRTSGDIRRDLDMYVSKSGVKFSTRVAEYVAANGTPSAGVPSDIADLGNYLNDVGGFQPMYAFGVLKLHGVSVPDGDYMQALGLAGMYFTDRAVDKTAIKDQKAAEQKFGAKARTITNVRGGRAGARTITIDSGVTAAIKADAVSMGMKIHSDDKAFNKVDKVKMLTTGKSTKTYVSVKTKDGRQVLALEEAQRLYPDQIQNGSAIIVSGADEQYLNKSIGEAFGMPASQMNQDAPSAREGKKKGGTQETIDQFVKSKDAGDRAAAKDSKNVNVTIGFKGNAGQILTAAMGGPDPYGTSGTTPRNTASDIPVMTPGGG